MQHVVLFLGTTLKAVLHRRAKYKILACPQQFAQQRPRWSEHEDTLFVLGAYERHIQLGLIAQGLIQYLALHFRRVAWFNLHTYIRTAVPQKPPSERGVSRALRHICPEFLRSSAQTLSLKKFPASKTDPRFCGYSDAFNLDKDAQTFHCPVMHKHQHKGNHSA
jgi:hypothetical protein